MENFTLLSLAFIGMIVLTKTAVEKVEDNVQDLCHVIIGPWWSGPADRDKLAIGWYDVAHWSTWWFSNFTRALKYISCQLTLIFNDSAAKLAHG